MENNFTDAVTGRLNHPDDIQKYFSGKSFMDWVNDPTNPLVYCLLTIDGKDFLIKNSFSTKLHQKTNQLDSFSITVPSDALDAFEDHVLDKSKYLLGKQITLNFKQYGAVQQSFFAIIDQVKDKRDATGYGKIVLKGKSPALLLHGGKRHRSFTDKTLLQIINKVCESYPPEAKIAVSEHYNTRNIVLPYIVQAGETDYEFLQRLAIKYGEYFYYNGEKLIFGNEVQPIIQIGEGLDLDYVDLKLKLKPQNFAYQTYNDASARSSEQSTDGFGRNSFQDKINPMQVVALNQAEKVFTQKPKMHYNLTNIGASADEELKDALYREKEKRQNVMTVKGRSRNPALRIGSRAEMSDINSRAMETYRILDIKHFHNGNEYYNTFTAIPDLFQAPYQDNKAIALGEEQPAKVIDNNDPEARGRVQVQFPWQQNDGERTPWLRLNTLHTGAGKGTNIIPEIGEEVLIAYESGNAEKPYVVGALYNGAESSGFHTAGNDLKVIKTRSGTKIIMNDAEGSIFIEDPSGNTYLMDGQGNIKVKAPKNMTFEAGKNMYLKAGKNMYTTVGMNKMEFTGANYSRTIGLNYISSVSGNSTSKIKGKSLTQSQSQLKIEAKQMDVAGFDNLFLHSDKAAKINSKGIVHVQGLDGTQQNNTPDNYSAIIEEKEAICIANVRPLPEWKGEFGCDYYQSGNSALGDEFDFSKIIGKYYNANDNIISEKLKSDLSLSFAKYYIKNCNQWYSYTPDGEGKYDLVHNFKSDPQYKSQDNSLETLQNQYIAFKYKKKKDDKETANCYAGYISLFPSDWKTDVPKSADLKLHFDFLTAEKPDEIIFKFDDKLLDGNSPVKISPSSISAPGEIANITVSSVERYLYSKLDEDFISIKIIAKKKQGEKNVETDAGEIRLMNPKRAKTLKILQMAVKTANDKYIELKSEVKSYTKKILNQCLIDPEFIEFTNQNNADGTPKKFLIDVSSKNPKRLLNAREISEGNWQINDEKGELGKLLLDNFLEKYPQYKSNEYFRLYVMDVDSVDNGAKENGYSSLGMNYCILFKSADKSTLPHEALHGLGLSHTFCSKSQFTFKALVTHNIMDYSDMKNDPVETVTNFNNKTPNAPSKFVPLEQYQLWFWQWLIASKTNTKV